MVFLKVFLLFPTHCTHHALGALVVLLEPPDPGLERLHVLLVVEQLLLDHAVLLLAVLRRLGRRLLGLVPGILHAGEHVGLGELRRAVDDGGGDGGVGRVAASAAAVGGGGEAGVGALLLVVADDVDVLLVGLVAGWNVEGAV